MQRARNSTQPGISEIGYSVPATSCSCGKTRFDSWCDPGRLSGRHLEPGEHRHDVGQDLWAVLDEVLSERGRDVSPDLGGRQQLLAESDTSDDMRHREPITGAPFESPPRHLDPALARAQEPGPSLSDDGSGYAAQRPDQQVSAITKTHGGVDDRSGRSRVEAGYVGSGGDHDHG